MKAITLTGLKIWDGDDFVDADTIRIEDQQITGVGDKAELRKSTVGDAADVRDCAGLTAIPGLIDAHVHLELNPDDKGAPASTNLEQMPQMQARAHAMAASGITTARDLGGGAWLELKLRDDIAAGKVVGPRLLCSGQPITTPNGHCHFWGGEAATVAEATTVIDRNLAHDVDLIKVMATGGRITKGSDPLKAQYDTETLTKIVAVAKSHNMPVAAHCHGTEGIEVAARAGVTTIEHCSWVGNDGWASDYQEPIAKIILEQGIWVSPTVNRGWQRMLDSKTGAVLKRVREAYQRMMAMGIPMVASTDAGIPGVYHHHLSHALVVFQKIAELTTAQTLQSATSNAALALGIENLTGRITPGLAADILLVNGNPLTDLAVITEPAGVFAKGAAVSN